MPEIDLHVRCENDADQAEVVARLDELGLPDGSFVADPTDAYFLLQGQSADAALAHASVLVRGALAVTAIDPATVSLSAETWLAGLSPAITRAPLTLLRGPRVASPFA